MAKEFATDRWPINLRILCSWTRSLVCLLALLWVANPAQASVIRADFSGTYNVRYGNPFDPASYQYYPEAFSGWFAYEQSTPASASSNASATYAGAIQHFQFSSNEFIPFYGKSVISDDDYPNFTSSIFVQGGPYPGLATFNIMPTPNNLLQTSLTFPDGYFSTTALPGGGLDQNNAIIAREFYGLGCTQFSPCGPAGEGSLSNFRTTNAQYVAIRPDVQELAALSEATYHDTNGTRFSQIDQSTGGAASGFRAVAYRDGDQIVIAIRGTDPHRIQGFKDLASDTSFVTNTPSNSLQSYVGQAVAFLTQIHTQYPGLNITLTGHSLGGAIAEILADSSRYSAVTFNAPGPADLEPALSGIVSSILNLAGRAAPSITSYRLWGDAVSVAGVHINDDANVITLAPALGHEDDGVTASGALHLHAIETMISELAAGRTQLAGAPGPVYPLNIVNGSIITLGVIISGVLIDPISVWSIDPPSAGGYVFTETDASPDLASLQIPEFTGLDHYLISTRAGDGWGDGQTLDPLTWYYFGQGVKSFRILGVDQAGAIANFNDALLFDLRFRSGGLLNAQIDFLPRRTTSGVPEPSQWMLFIAGFFVAGASLRARRSGSGSGRMAASSLSLCGLPGQLDTIR